MNVLKLIETIYFFDFSTVVKPNSVNNNTIIFRRFVRFLIQNFLSFCRKKQYVHFLIVFIFVIVDLFSVVVIKFREKKYICI